MFIKWKHLPDSVASKLREFHRRRQIFALLRVQLLTVLLYGFLLLLAVHLDRFAYMDPAGRRTLFMIVHLAAGIFWLAASGFVLFRRRTPRQIAYQFEAGLPDEVSESYVTLENILERARRPGSDSREELSELSERFLSELEHGTIEHSSGIRPAELVKDRLLIKLAVICVLMISFFGLLFLPENYQFPLMLRRIYRPGAELPRPSFVSLSVSHHRDVIAMGEEAVIEAEVSGEVPAFFRWIYSLFGTYETDCVMSVIDGEDSYFDFMSGRLSYMSRIHQTLFMAYRGNVETTFSYMVRSGDAHSLPETVRVVRQPAVTKSSVTVVPPEYTGLPQTTFENPHVEARNLAVLPRTDLSFTFEIDRQVKTVQFLIDGEPDHSDFTWDSANLEGKFQTSIAREMGIEVVLTDEDGISNRDPVRLNIVLREDRPPVIRMVSPSEVHIERVPGEIVPFRIEIEDDFGIESVFLRYTRNPDAGGHSDETREIPIPVEEGEREMSIEHIFDIADVGAVPGDELMIQFRARDSGGNDSFSPVVIIDIVPFTRDENERHRLAVLDYLGWGMGVVAGGFESGDLNPPSLPERIKERAAERGFRHMRKAGVEGLLEMLELEHHFTDRPRHKEDIRRLGGLVHYYLMAGGDAAESADIFARLSEDLIPGITVLRRAKNILWRYYGMNAETVRIVGRMRELQEEDEAEIADELRALTRRIDLYLDALQDIGGDMIVIARTSPHLSAEEVERAVGDINVAGYRMNRGALSGRIEAGGRVQAAIMDVMDSLHGYLADFAVEEVEKRRELRQLYRDVYSSVTANLERKEHRDWLDWDMRFMRWNPFLSIWPRLERAVLLRQADGHGGIDAGTGNAALLYVADQAGVDAAELAEAIEMESAALNEKAFIWEIRRTAAEPEIFNIERAIDSAVSGLERALWDDYNAGQSVGHMKSILAECVPSRELSDTELNDILDAVTGDPGANLKMMHTGMEKIKSLHPFAGSMLHSLLLELAGNVRRVQRAIVEITEGTPRTPRALRNAVAELLEATEADREMFESAVNLAYINLAIAGEGEERKVLEKILLDIRQLIDRYRFRLSPLLAEVEVPSAVAEPEPETDDRADEIQDVETDVPPELMEMRTHLFRFMGIYDIVRERIEAMPGKLAGDIGLDEERLERFTLYDDYSESAKLARWIRSAYADVPSEAEKEAFLSDFPEAGVHSIIRYRPLVQSISSNIQALTEGIAQRALSRDQAIDGMQAILSELKSFGAAVERVSDTDAAAQFIRRTNQLANALNRALTDIQGSAELDGRARSRALYQMEEISDNIRALQREIDFESEVIMQTATGATGGPADVWAEHNQTWAQYSRSRTLSVAGEALGEVFNAAINVIALNGEVDSADYRSAVEAGFAWSVLYYRLVRSEIYGTGAMRMPAADVEIREDPRIAFLEAEIRDAMRASDIKYYEVIVKEYLESMRDFLRY